MRVENIKGAVWTVDENEFCKRRLTRGVEKGNNNHNESSSSYGYVFGASLGHDRSLSLRSHNTSTGDDQALYSYPFGMEDDYKDFKVGNSRVRAGRLISFSLLRAFSILTRWKTTTRTTMTIRLVFTETTVRITINRETSITINTNTRTTMTVARTI